MGEPPVEEGLDVRWAQAVTDLLERRGVGAGEEPVVQGDDADPLVPELPLRPLVPVQAALHGVRGVAAHLQEGGPPRGIEHVDVVMIHAIHCLGHLLCDKRGEIGHGLFPGLAITEEVPPKPRPCGEDTLTHGRCFSDSSDSAEASLALNIISM